MSEKKFIDLGPQIAEGTGYDPGSRGHLAQLSTLHWLDAHPEADPANEEHEEFVNDICALLPERYDDDVAAEAIVLWAVRDLVARAEAQLTITESELETIASDLATYEGAVWKNRIRKHLAHIGVRVVPDPEPTNAERLRELLDSITVDEQRLDDLAHDLDEAGVTAPGGEDDEQ
ncbi:hypothetical protein ACP6NG_08995 [Brevibacterium casei]|uniref:hypothetical protein n=1 Tax=Brevibacterium casei TaxID=33889 RepID=UPI003F7E6FB7